MLSSRKSIDPGGKASSNGILCLSRVWISKNIPPAPPRKGVTNLSLYRNYEARTVVARELRVIHSAPRSGRRHGLSSILDQKDAGSGAGGEARAGARPPRAPVARRRRSALWRSSRRGLRCHRLRGCALLRRARQILRRVHLYFHAPAHFTSLTRVRAGSRHVFSQADRVNAVHRDVVALCQVPDDCIRALLTQRVIVFVRAGRIGEALHLDNITRSAGERL